VNNQPWVNQELVTLSISPEQATTSSITSVSPSVIYVGLVPTLTFTGATPSSVTMVSFTSTGSCTQNQAITLIYASGSVTLSSSILTAGTQQLCYSTNSGGTWFLQSNPNTSVVALPQNATSTSITLISPTGIQVGQTEPFILQGAVPSSVTMFGFVSGSAGNCNVSSNVISQTAYASISTLISAAFKNTGVYYVCYSTNSGQTWVGQTTSGVSVLVIPPPATANSITSITNPIIVNAYAAINASGAVPSTESIIRITDDIFCLTDYFDVAYTEVNAPLLTPITAAGTYSVCYSTDSRTTWQFQNNVQVEVNPPPATSTSITAISPSTAICGPGQTYTFTFSGIIPSLSTYVAIVPEGESCADGNFTGSTILVNTSPTTYSASFQGNYFPQYGYYSVCYSTDDQQTWALQTLPAAVILAVPPPPTISSIISVTLNGSNSSLPVLYVGVDNQVVDIAGGYLSPYSVVAFVLVAYGDCYLNQLVSTSNFTTRAIALSSFPSAGLYVICYSTNSGQSFVRQENGYLQLNPPTPTSNTVTAVTPSNFTVGSASYSAANTLQLIGAVASSFTVFAFVPEGQQCTGIISSNLIRYDDSTVYIPTFSKTGRFSICLSIVGGAPYYLQTNPNAICSVFPEPATSTSIQFVSPPLIYIGITNSTSVFFIGAVPSDQTYGAFTATDCSLSNLLAVSLINSTGFYIADLPPPGIYHVCYTTSGSQAGWFQQFDSNNDAISVQFSNVVTQNDTSIPPNSPLIVSTDVLIGAIVGGVCGLLLVIAIILGIYFYQRNKKLKKYKAFVAAKPPATQLAFLSDNPIFESSPTYESKNPDPFKK